MDKHEKGTPPGSRPLPLRPGGDQPPKGGKHEGNDSDQKGGKGK